MLVTLRTTAVLPELRVMYPSLKMSSPGILPASVGGNLSNEGTAKVALFSNGPCKQGANIYICISTKGHLKQVKNYLEEKNHVMPALGFRFRMQ